MKNIKSFEDFVNESNQVNLITESISDDIEVFKRKHGKKLEKNWGEVAVQRLESLADTKGKTKVWKVYEGDDYGREVTLLGLFNAISREHAKLRASIILNSIEIYATGFYGAQEISSGDIKAKIKAAEEKLNILKNIQ